MKNWPVTAGLRWLVIAVPIGIAKVFGLLNGYFSRPEYIGIGLALAFLVVAGATLIQARWRTKPHAAD